MHATARELLEINERLNGAAGPSVETEGNELFLVIGGQRMKIDLPPGFTGPPQVKEVGFVSSFNPAASSSADDPKTDDLRRELASKAEQFYYDGHKVVTLIRGAKKPDHLPGVRKLKYTAVSAVRNSLLEHAGEEAYTFGHGAGGPYVRPIRGPGAGYYDSGLVWNATTFIESLEKAFPLSDAAKR